MKRQSDPDAASPDAASSVLLGPPPEAGRACGGGTGTRSRHPAPHEVEPSQGGLEAVTSLVVPGPTSVASVGPTSPGGAAPKRAYCRRRDSSDAT